MIGQSAAAPIGLVIVLVYLLTSLLLQAALTRASIDDLSGQTGRVDRREFVQQKDRFSLAAHHFVQLGQKILIKGRGVIFKVAGIGRRHSGFGSGGIGTTYLSVINGNFEEMGPSDEPTGWILMGMRPQDYVVSQDDTIYFSGEYGSMLASRVSEAREFGTMMQSLTPDESVLGRRVRLLAQIKAEDVDDWAGLWMRVDGKNSQALQFDNMQNRPIRGTTDWQQYEVVLDVPPESNNISFGVLLAGNGRIWIDNVQLEVVSDDVPLTDLMSRQELSNLDIEVRQSVPTEWFLAGSRPQDYEVNRDEAVFASGEASALLASTVDEAPEFGTLMQTFPADDYRGQRVRLSALIKTEHVTDWAGLWMRIDGANRRVLQFDNMEDRAITGTTDWTRYEIVLDIPLESATINLGLLLDGTGQAWVDDVALEVVDEDVPSTDSWALPMQPVNLDFEDVGDRDLPDGWAFGGIMWEDHEARRDSEVYATGTASALLASAVEKQLEPRMLMQSFDPANYLGQRVRLSAQIKTEAVSGWAGLWMSVGRSENEVFQFDNMQNRPIIGTTDWTRYEIVLHVPTASEQVSLGVLLQGNGRVWIDDVTLEVVSDDVPSTHCRECWETTR